MSNVGRLFTNNKFENSDEFNAYNKFLKKNFNMEFFLPQTGTRINLKEANMSGLTDNSKFSRNDVVGSELLGIRRFNEKGNPEIIRKAEIIAQS